MTTVVLLRGTSVGGSGKLLMADLKVALTAAKVENPVVKLADMVKARR